MSNDKVEATFHPGAEQGPSTPSNSLENLQGQINQDRTEAGLRESILRGEIKSIRRYWYITTALSIVGFASVTVGLILR